MAQSEVVPRTIDAPDTYDAQRSESKLCRPATTGVPYGARRISRRIERSIFYAALSLPFVQIGDECVAFWSLFVRSL